MDILKSPEYFFEENTYEPSFSILLFYFFNLSIWLNGHNFPFWLIWSNVISGRLASSVPSTGRCHTNHGAFSPSSLPGAGSTKDIIVCYGKANTCQSSKEAMVTNCGTFYVYQLPDVPFCSVRYCAAWYRRSCQNGYTSY